MATEFIDILVRLHEEKTSHAVATAVESAGSVAGGTGSRAVTDGGRVGRGCAGFTTCQAAVDCITCEESVIIDFHRDDPEDFASIATRHRDDHASVQRTPATNPGYGGVRLPDALRAESPSARATG